MVFLLRRLIFNEPKLRHPWNGSAFGIGYQPYLSGVGERLITLNTAGDGLLACNSAHNTVQSVYLPNQRALANTSNRRITRQFTDSIQLLREEKRPRSCSRSTSCGLTTSMSPANYTN